LTTTPEPAGGMTDEATPPAGTAVGAGDSAAASIDEPAAGTVELRVLSYNIRSMRDDTQALFQVIRECDPDVVCVQEAPRFLRWRTKCAWLAHEAGLVVLTGGRAAGAMLLLGSLRTKVVYTENRKLTRLPGLHQRGLAVAIIDIPGPGQTPLPTTARLCVATIHLSLLTPERREQVDEVLGHLDRVASLPGVGTPHVIVAGDINERPTGESWRALATRFRDAYPAAPWGGEFTSNAKHPYKRIDGIFVSDQIEVVRCGVPEHLPGLDVASDHRPVLATVRVPAQQSA
jgi:endonuclease/exonuclease/phosphatase family metal-dependent hydrolase